MNRFISMTLRLGLGLVITALASQSAFAQPVTGGVPASAECSIDICVPPDLSIVPNSPPMECVEMFIGQEETLCCEFLVTGGEGLNFTVQWSVDAENPSIADVADETAYHGPTDEVNEGTVTGETDFEAEFDGNNPTHDSEYFIRLCGLVTANSAGMSAINYEINITDYSF